MEDRRCGTCGSHSFVFPCGHARPGWLVSEEVWCTRHMKAVSPFRDVCDWWIDEMAHFVPCSELVRSGHVDVVFQGESLGPLNGGCRQE